MTMTRVLLLENDQDFAGGLRDELARLGCAVQVMDDANAGIQAATDERPDIILVSVELPSMGGFAICNRLKRDNALRKVPLVLMSSESTDDTFERHRSLRTHAEDYVHKPIKFVDLVHRMRT